MLQKSPSPRSERPLYYAYVRRLFRLGLILHVDAGQEIAYWQYPNDGKRLHELDFETALQIVREMHQEHDHQIEIHETPREPLRRPIILKRLEARAPRKVETPLEPDESPALYWHTPSYPSARARLIQATDALTRAYIQGNKEALERALEEVEKADAACAERLNALHDNAKALEMLMQRSREVHALVTRREETPSSI